MVAPTGAVMVACAVMLAASAPAQARPMRFLGPHPVSAALGGGYCYIEGPHLHAYAPDHGSLYSRVDGELVFAADPTPFGYEGPKFTFYGNHPLPGMPEVYCYLDGPHVHPYAPPEPGYKVEHGVAFYVGPYAPLYYKERPVRARAYDAIYHPYVAVRPTVTVAPPPEWHGEVWVAPPPSVGFHAGVTVPPPPSANVTITVPPPPRFDIHIGGPVVQPPPMVVVEPPPPGVIVVGGHHDNGKHKGWYKHHGEYDDDDRGDEREHGHGKWKEKWKGGKHEHDD